LSDAVVQLQRPIDLRHNGVRKAPQFFAETGFVDGTGLMHHDLGAGGESPRLIEPICDSPLEVAIKSPDFVGCFLILNS
jgi:hypothetical protein